MANLVADAAMVATGDEATRWAGYSGLYRAPAWGVLDPTGPPDRFVVDAGVPYFEAEDETESLVRHRLAEVEPGLFLADNGETLDLRGQVPTWRNFRLVRVSGGPSQWQWAILGAAALVAVTWLVAALARIVRRSARLALLVGGSANRDPPLARAHGGGRKCDRTAHARNRDPSRVDARARRRRIPGLARPVSGWRLAVHLPLAVVVLGASTVALVASGWIGRWWSSAVRLQYAALAVAAVALGALLAGWDLIGWGMK